MEPFANVVIKLPLPIPDAQGKWLFHYRIITVVCPCEQTSLDNLHFIERQLANALVGMGLYRSNQSGRG